MPDTAYATTQVCIDCGETKPLDAFSPNTKGPNRRRPECRPCANARQRIREAAKIGKCCTVRYVSCVRCRQVFILRGRRVSCQNPECQALRRNPPLPERECDFCHGRFTPVKVAHRFCSTACWRHSEAGRACRRAWEKTQAGREWAGRRRRQRRARKAGVAAVPYVAREIFERDRWRCMLCGRKLNRRAKWPHPDSASIDHVIPLAQGGGDNPLNVQAAHLLCNSAKGHRGGGEQLRLVA